MSSFFELPPERGTSARGGIPKPLSSKKRPQPTPTSQAAALKDQRVESTLPDPQIDPTFDVRDPSVLSTEDDPAFQFDEVYDTEIAAAKAASLGHRTTAGEEPARFTSSLAAAAKQREWDAMELAVARNKAERLAEADRTDLARIDEEVGIFETDGYRKRKQERLAEREGRSFADPEDVVGVTFRRKGKDPKPPGSVDDEPPVAAESAAGPAVLCEKASWVDTAPCGSGPPDGPADREQDDSNHASDMVTAEAALARYEEARRAARAKKAQQRLTEHTLERMRELYRQKQTEYAAELLRECSESL